VVGTSARPGRILNTMPKLSPVAAGGLSRVELGHLRRLSTRPNVPLWVTFIIAGRAPWCY
jgi:hypothetical protein